MSTEPSLRRRLEDAVARDGAPSSDFDLNRNIALPEGRVLRPAGVLLGLQMQQGNGANWLDEQRIVVRPLAKQQVTP